MIPYQAIVSAIEGQAPLREGWPPVGTDAFNAAMFVENEGHRWRYNYDSRRWMVWDGRRWADDRTGRHLIAAKKVAVAMLNEGIRTRDRDLEKSGKAALDGRKLSAMLSLAEPELAITYAELDLNPYLLNCSNGAVDLRTSELLPHNSSDYITRLVDVPYDAAASCRLWIPTLQRLMGGGPDASEVALDRADRLVAYLQRVFGYSLTGVTSEKAVFVLYGSGNNGKTTILATFRQLIEEYSAFLQADTLMTKQENNNSQADLADLRGARFVQTSETEEGHRFAQGKLKRITQGMGRIKAVRKYENPIEFPETHKLFVDTNRRPEISDADDRATFNRLHPIPFAVVIPDEEIDRELPQKLAAEARGILAWAVEGARQWYAGGLQRPQEVTDARTEWQAESDQIGRFLDDWCVLLESLRTSADVLYSAYAEWAERSGERRPVTASAFGRKLVARGFEKQHTNRGKVYSGIGIRTSQPDSGGEK